MNDATGSLYLAQELPMPYEVLKRVSEADCHYLNFYRINRCLSVRQVVGRLLPVPLRACASKDTHLLYDSHL